MNLLLYDSKAPGKSYHMVVLSSILVKIVTCLPFISTSSFTLSIPRYLNDPNTMREHPLAQAIIAAAPARFQAKD